MGENEFAINIRTENIGGLGERRGEKLESYSCQWWEDVRRLKIEDER